jgi:hypothetical protein
MPDLKPVTDALDALELKYGHEAVEDGVVRFDIVVDEAEHVEATGLLYDSPEGAVFRLMGYVDEVQPEDELDQLRTLLAINIDLVTGAYCLDREQNVVYATVSFPLDAVSKDTLDWGLEFLLMAQDLYFQEFYGEEEGDAAQG